MYSCYHAAQGCVADSEAFPAAASAAARSAPDCVADSEALLAAASATASAPLESGCHGSTRVWVADTCEDRLVATQSTPGRQPMLCVRMPPRARARRRRGRAA
eukprot:COSAG03_NODE_5173_length_1325_cov_28.999184_3_plen_102_part_01